MKLSQAANVGDNYEIGSFVVSQLEFNVLDLNSHINETTLADVSFEYKMGIEVLKSNVFPIWEKQKPDLMCIKNTIAYGIKEGKLIAYDTVTGTLKAGIAMPTVVPHCLIIEDNLLYCGDNVTLDCYDITADGLVYSKAIALTSWESENVAYLIKKQRALLKQVETTNAKTAETVTEYEFDYFNMQKISLTATKSEFIKVGKFIVTEAKRSSTVVKIKALDYGTRFNYIIDSLLNKLTYPITPFEALRKICANFDVSLKDYTPINKTFQLERNIKSKNITARGFIQWAAQLYGCVAVINSENQLEFLDYKKTDYVINPTDYYAPPTVFEYQTQKINKLVVEIPTKNDVIEIETGQNVYRINENPFFVTDNKPMMVDYLKAIYDKISLMTYQPYSIRCVGNPLVKVGDIITINTVDGKVITAYIMERVQDGVYGLTDTYTAVGKINRIEIPSQSAQTESLVAETVDTDSSADKYVSDNNNTGDISVGTTVAERALLVVLSKDAHMFLNVITTSTATAQGVVTILIKLGGILFYTYKQAIQIGEFAISFEFPLWSIARGENRVSIEITSTTPFIIKKFDWHMWLRSKGIVGGKSDKYPAIDVIEPVKFAIFSDNVAISLQIPKPLKLTDVPNMLILTDSVSLDNGGITLFTILFNESTHANYNYSDSYYFLYTADTIKLNNTFVFESTNVAIDTGFCVEAKIESAKFAQISDIKIEVS